MNEKEYREDAQARTERQEVADAKRNAAIALKRLNLAADQLVSAQTDLHTIETTSTEPAIVTIAEARRQLVGASLVTIGKGNPIP